MNDRFVSAIEEIDYLLAESERLTASGPNFEIVHRYQEAIVNCGPGEEITGIWLVHRSRKIPLRLSLALRILFDYLGRYRHIPQSAGQIEAGIRNDPFYARHGGNAKPHTVRTRRVSRSSVKTYIARLRDALRSAFREAGITVDPCEVLVSEETAGNSVGYRLRGNVRLVHFR